MRVAAKSKQELSQRNHTPQKALGSPSTADAKMEDGAAPPTRNMSHLSLHYSNGSFHTPDDDTGSMCSQVVTYADASIDSKLNLLELANSSNFETHDKEHLRRQLTGLFTKNNLGQLEAKSPAKSPTKYSFLFS